MTNIDIQVRELEKKDFDDLSDFLSSNAKPKYSKSDYLKRFNFWWLSNPAFKKNDKMGWVIIDKSKKKYIKGFLGNIPADYCIDGKIYSTASPTTWIVNKNFKNYSLKLLFPFIKQEKDILVNSTPGDLTEEIFMKFGFIDIARNQNNYIFLCNHKPLEYFIKNKILNFKFIYFPLSKIIFFCYKLFFLKKFISIKNEINYQSIHNPIEIDKLLNKKNLKLLNFHCILKDDKNKFFLKISNKDELDNFLYFQYVDNPVNQLRYIQILETNINSSELIKNIALRIANEKHYKLDYIIYFNSVIKSLFYGPFFKFNFLSRSKCLVRSEKIKVKNIIPNATFGEKGFVIWN